MYRQHSSVSPSSFAEMNTHVRRTVIKKSHLFIASWLCRRYCNKTSAPVLPWSKPVSNQHTLSARRAMMQHDLAHILLRVLQCIFEASGSPQTCRHCRCMRRREMDRNWRDIRLSKRSVDRYHLAALRKACNNAQHNNTAPERTRILTVIYFKGTIDICQKHIDLGVLESGGAKTTQTCQTLGKNTRRVRKRRI